LLGPLEVTAGGAPVRLGGRKQRAVLALLLLDAGTIVSRERLIDALWGERPPPTAGTALHGHVSQLRKALEPERPAGADPAVLVTSEPGYRLAVAPEQLDVERFRSLTERGRERLAADEPAAAAELLREALALWRGEPLADLAGERFAAAAAGRLEEERLAALEDRIEADMALGKHADLVPELEALVANEPLRERPRAQLMLALYRSGRQADALAAYRDAHRTLVDEVGLEPGPALRELEGRVLAQDPALAVAPPRGPITTATVRRSAPAATARPRSRRRRPLVGALLLAGAAVVVVVLATAPGDGGKRRSVKVTGDSVAAIDPATNQVVANVPVGGTPTSIAAGEGAIWVLNADDQTVSRVDPASATARSFGTGATPVDLAVGEGGVWIANGKRLGGQFVGPSTTSISRLDPATNGVRATVALRRPRGAANNTHEDRLAVGRGAVWAVQPDYSVARIDPRTTEIVSRTHSLAAADVVAAGPDGVWAGDTGTTIRRIDKPGPPIRLGATSLAGMAVGAGAVWVTAPYDGTLWRVDPEPRLVERTIAVGAGAAGVTVGAGSVWVANPLRGTVSRVDPATNRVTRVIALGGTPRRLVVADGRVWVTVGGAVAEQPAVGSSPAPALPPPSCGPLYYAGGGRPDGLIVSDMPLRGGGRVATVQMAEAIEFVLRRRGFRAGRFKVGYQSCDDSTAQTGIFDPDKCNADARAFVALPAVIGEVGPYNSGCAISQIPVANRATGGPLAMLSPTATLSGLTRQTPDTPEGGIDALYPTGRRNFARLYPPEVAQGAALASEARRLGAHSVFVLSDGGYGEATAFGFARAARRLGLGIAGSARWRGSERGGYPRLARTVARSRADAVLVSGLIDSNAGRLIADLRRALPRRVDLIGGDGLLPLSQLFRSAGPAARGMRVSFPGLTNESLPPEGRQFVAAFGATQPGARVDETAVYAAAAANAMLDAIAGSDGSRRSVTARMLSARTENSLVGPLGFDASGDPLDVPITILRAERGGGSNRVMSHEGASVERVAHPPAALWR
jgi:YVTN family beta-propeller protein